MACHGQCVSCAAFQQPANFNVVLVELCSYQMVPGLIPGGRTCKCGRQDKAGFARQMQHSYALATAAHLPSYLQTCLQTYLQTYSDIPEKRAGV